MSLRLKGVDGLTIADINAEVTRGARFVVFQWVVSLVYVSFRRNSPIFFVRSGEGTLKKCLPYCARSLVLGWWGIPWGFIWTPFSVLRNLRGGIDVTLSVASGMNRRNQASQVSQNGQDWNEAEVFLASVRPM